MIRARLTARSGRRAGKADEDVAMALDVGFDHGSCERLPRRLARKPLDRVAIEPKRSLVITAHGVDGAKSGVSVGGDGVLADRVAPDLQLAQEQRFRLGRPAFIEDDAAQFFKRGGDAGTVLSVNLFADADRLGVAALCLGEVASGLGGVTHAKGLDARLFVVWTELGDGLSKRFLKA